MPSSCPSSENLPERSASPQMEGRHPQVPSLLAFIDHCVVAHIPPKNQFSEPKKIPYALPIYESGIPSWSSCEYSSTLASLALRGILFICGKLT